MSIRSRIQYHMVSSYGALDANEVGLALVGDGPWPTSFYRYPEARRRSTPFEGRHAVLEELLGVLDGVGAQSPAALA